VVVALSLTEQACALPQLPALPPDQAKVNGVVPLLQTAVKVTGTPIKPVPGPCIEHPPGGAEPMLQVNTWFGAVPVNVRLSQFIWKEVECAAVAQTKIAAPANARTACRIQDRIILTPK
jgi:hypothetical protein